MKQDSEHLHAYVKRVGGQYLCRCGKDPYIVEGELRAELARAMRQIEELNRKLSPI